MTLFDDMMKKAANADGFLAALDQSGGSTPKALKAYGVPDDVSCAINRINPAYCFTAKTCDFSLHMMPLPLRNSTQIALSTVEIHGRRREHVRNGP